MASLQHDFIVSSIARKIKLAKFDIYYIDGRYQDICLAKPDIPPKILRHRPDIIGIYKDRFFIIGEAKTQNDINSVRTKNQIIDFINAISLNENNRLIIGVPLDSKGTLETLFNKLGISNNNQLDVLYIPNVLLPEENEI